MPVSPDLLNLLRCPETMQPVRPATQEEMALVNQAISSGSCQSQSQEQVTAPLEEALIREDGKLLFPVVNGIPVMMADEAIPVQK